ncbi:MAG: hypothetical protein R3C99_01115 [Pirellulaceae bacterium]
MPIETLCPGCGRKLRVAEEHAGKQARCPVCGTIYSVGAVSASETPASADRVAPAPSSQDQVGTNKPVAAPASTYVEPRPADDWYMRTPEGQTYGPVTKAELDRWLGEGRVSHDCDLRNGSAAWQSAEVVFPSLKPNRTFAVSPTTSPADFSGHRGANPYAESNSFSPNASPAFAPAGAAYGNPSMYAKPHRGVIVLVLAIIGWVSGCFVFGTIAWIMGAADVREMKLGRMDNSGLGLTQAGYVLGAIHTVLAVLGLLVFLFIMVMAIATS